MSNELLDSKSDFNLIAYIGEFKGLESFIRDRSLIEHICSGEVYEQLKESLDNYNVVWGVEDEESLPLMKTNKREDLCSNVTRVLGFTYDKGMSESRLNYLTKLLKRIKKEEYNLDFYNSNDASGRMRLIGQMESKEFTEPSIIYRSAELVLKMLLEEVSRKIIPNEKGHLPSITMHSDGFLIEEGGEALLGVKVIDEEAGRCEKSITSKHNNRSNRLINKIPKEVWVVDMGKRTFMFSELTGSPDDILMELPYEKDSILLKSDLMMGDIRLNDILQVGI